MRMSSFICLAAALLFSCSTGSGPEPVASQVPQAAGPGPEALPWMDDLHGSVSATTQLEALGKDWFNIRSGWAQGNDCMLLADPGLPAWVMYRLHPGASSFSSVSFELADISMPGRLWVGYADYKLGRWAWLPYTTGMNQLSVGWEDMLSPAGNIYFAFATHDGGSLRVLRSWIEVDLPEWDIHTVDDLHPESLVFTLARLSDRAAIIYERNGLLGNELVMGLADIARPLSAADWTFHDIETGYPNKVQAVRMDSFSNIPVIAVMYGPDGQIPPEIYYAHGMNGFPNGIGEWHWSSMGYGLGDRNVGLAIIDGRPAVAFVSEGIAQPVVMYRRATKPVPLGDADWEEVVAAEELPPGSSYNAVTLTSLAGRPALTFVKYPDRQLVYAYSPHAMPVDPADFSASEVDNILGQRAGCCIDLDGKPALAFLQDEDSLRYNVGSTADPAGAGDFLQRHSVDVGVRVEGDPSVQLIRIPGGLGIAYRHSGSLAVHYAWTSTLSPAAGTEWKTVMVDPRPSTGSLGLVLMPDNGPGILYHTVVPDGLQFAQLKP